MGVICIDPPPPQDSPPPKEWQKKKYSLAGGLLSKTAVTQPHPGLKSLAKSCCPSTPLQQVLCSSDVKTTVHEDDGRKRVCVFVAVLLII